MTDQNRGIMKYDYADSGIAIALSASFVLGAIALLVFWAMQNAYPW